VSFLLQSHASQHMPIDITVCTMGGVSSVYEKPVAALRLAIIEE